MAKWVLQDVIDEHAMSPDALQQVIGMLKGYDAFGAAMTPTLEDDAKFHSFENKGIGGVLKLIGANGASVFFAASDSTTPVPTVDNADPTIDLYGPNNQPILTTRNSAEVHRKSFPAGAGNTMDASQITSGTIDSARLPAATPALVVQFKHEDISDQDVENTAYTEVGAITLTVGGSGNNDLFVQVACGSVLGDSDTDNDLVMELRLDGVSVGIECARVYCFQTERVSLAFQWLFENVSAGSHTVQLRAKKNDAGSAHVIRLGVNCRWSITELTG